MLHAALKPRRLAAAVALAGVTLVALASSAPDEPVGDPIQLNLVGGQIAAGVNIARGQDGDFVAVWYRERDPEFARFDSYARLFDVNGKALTGEIQVNTTTEAWEAVPRVARSASGDFVVVWESRSNHVSPPVFYGVHGQRYNASGQPVGQQFEINTSSTPVVPPANFIDQPSVAMAPDGRFVVVWRESLAVNARLYDALGQAQGEPFLVAAAGGDCWPDVDMDASGNFVVAWVDFNPNTGQDIFARRYSAAGQALGDAFEVNEEAEGTDDDQVPHMLPAVAVDADGDFAVAWNRSTAGSGDIFLRTYSRDEVPRTDPLKVSEGDTGQHGPGLDLDAEGYGVVAWDLTNDDRLAVRHFDPAGEIGDVFIVAQWVTDISWGGGAVGLDADGDVAYAWRSGWNYAQRTSGRRELDMAVAVQDSADPVPLSVAYSYLVRVTNNEAAVSPTGVAALDAAIGTATGVVVDIDLPPDASFQSFDAPGWTCSRDGLAARCVLDGKLAAQATADVTVHLTAPAQDGYTTLAAAVDADQFDASNTANNGDSEITAIGSPPPQDDTPDAFSFADETGVGRGTTVTSTPIPVSGINIPANIGVSGGSYSIGCNGAFTTAAGTIDNGQWVCVRHTASPQFSASVATVLTIGGVTDTFTSTTEAVDTVPFAFAFTDQDGVEPLAEVISDEITVTGINDAAGISVAGGQYSVNAGTFTASGGTVSNGDTVRVRHTASAAYAAAAATTLVIGGVSDTFTSTTRAGDAVPDGFGFEDQVGVQPGSQIISNSVTLTGFEVAVSISVSGGEYSLNNGAFGTASGSVSPGDSVRVRHTAASGIGAGKSTVLTVGGVSDTFTSTTWAGDTVPDAFSFDDQTGVEPGTLITSGPVTLTGFEAAPISVNGGEYSLDGGAFTSAAGTVGAGAVVRVRLTSPADYFSVTGVTLTVGGVGDMFSVTTRGTPEEDRGGSGSMSWLWSGAAFVATLLRRRRRSGA